MPISFISVVYKNHAMRHRYLQYHLGDVKPEGSDVIVINRIPEYRALENVLTSNVPWFKTLDLFNIEDDYRSKMVAMSHATNDIIAFMYPYGHYSKNALQRAEEIIKNGDFTGVIFGNQIIINPINGCTYRSKARVNVAINSLIVHRRALDGVSNVNSHLSASLYNVLSSKGQVCTLGNNGEYLEFMEYDGVSIAAKPKILGGSKDTDKMNTKIAKEALAYLADSVVIN